MHLAVGTFIGHYEILQELGAGGMGEVYRARDAKLGRHVALKILPDAFARDPDRLARFQREATTLASLNHPGIAQIHGVEETVTTRAIVMELVEGEDLAHRLARGRMPIDEALPVARQIAEAVEAAHAAGVVHRDLKPANIKLRGDGTVKVLDFGLAKLMAPAQRGVDLADAPTIATSAVTEGGLILGTVAYMAPEQARGRAVDRQTDVWAFGCVLFEMLTGRSCFRGEAGLDTLALVLSSEPDWTLLPDTTPEGVRRLLRRCLRKDPHHRLQDLGDARLEIEDAIASPRGAMAASRETAPRTGLPVLWLGVFLLVALAAALWFLGARSEPAAREVRVHRLTDLVGLEESPALSPDGRSVAFTAAIGGARQLFVRLVAGGAPLQITHAPGDHQFPRWSPDSSSIVYFSPALPGETEGAIWQISALGGVPRRLVSAIGGADFNAIDGRLTWFRLADQKIELVIASDDASSADAIVGFQPERYYLYPRWSPDGRWIAFQRGDGTRFDLFVVPARGGEPRQLTRENGMMAGLAWVPDSSGVLYSSSRGDTMPYLPTLNLWRVALTDGSVRQITSGETSLMAPDVDRNGVIVAGRLRLSSDIWRFPVDGSPAENVDRGVRVTRQTGHVLTPTASPDDREVAFLSDSGGHANLWVINTASGAMRQVTREHDANIVVGVPVWSPDGQSIAFVYTRGNPGLTFGVWLVHPDGSNLRQLANPALGPAWSHDGRWVYYATRGDAEVPEVVLKKIPVGGGTALAVTTDKLRNVIGTDGSTLYYTFERPLVDGTPEIEIRARSPEDGPVRVLARISPSRVPSWQIVNPALSPDGRWLAQALTDDFTTNVWALSTATGEWRQITDFGDRPTFIARRVSWSSDGRSVLAAVGEGDADIIRLEGLLDRTRD